MFKNNNQYKKFGEKIGFFTGYLLFSTALFFMIGLLKDAESWSYPKSLLIVFIITILGLMTKRMLR